MEAFELDMDEFEGASFEFADDFQERIAALAIKDTVFARRTDGLIKPGWLDNEAQSVLVKIATDFYKEYRQLPRAASVWANLLREAKEGKKIRDDLYPDVIETLKKLLKAPIADRDYIIDKVSDFAKHQAIQQAMMKALDLAEKKDYATVEKVFQDAFKVGASDEFQDTDFWADIETRTTIRKELDSGSLRPNGITTGIRKLDRLLRNEGWGRKELTIMMGPAKSGKSFSLSEFSVRASIAGFNVLLISLEVAKEIISDRLDAKVADTPIKELKDHLHAVREKILLKSSEIKVGTLKLVEFPTGKLTPAGLKRLVDRYKNDGIQFDLIAIDYLDLMRVDHPTTDAIQNSKTLWEDVRAIASEEDCAILSATQTNREGFKATVASAEHVASDINKIRTADLVISINKSDADKAAGQCRLYMAAARNDESEVTITVTQDLSRGQFIKSIVSVV